MQIHKLKLATEPFAAIKNGTKTIECRLYDEKRQLIQLGDKLLCTSREKPEETITANVVGLLRYASFKELFASNQPEKFGGLSAAGLLEQIQQFYTEAEELQYSVLGIQIKLV